MLNLEVLEKFFWTAFDFLSKRPRRFYRLRDDKPTHYMDPIPFAVACLLFYETISISAIKTTSLFLNWQAVSGSTFEFLIKPDITALIATLGAAVIFTLLFVIVWLMLAAILVGQRISLREAVISVCYATSTYLVAAAYFGMMVFIGMIISNVAPEKANVTVKYLFTGYTILNLALLGYFISSAAANAKIRFRRLLLGAVAAGILLFGALRLGLRLVLGDHP